MIRGPSSCKTTGVRAGYSDQVRIVEKTTVDSCGVETKFKRLGVETKLRRFGVDTRFKRLGTEINR